MKIQKTFACSLSLTIHTHTHIYIYYKDILSLVIKQTPEATIQMFTINNGLCCSYGGGNSHLGGTKIHIEKPVSLE